MTAFFDGWMRGTLIGALCFVAGVVAFDVALTVGLPTWASAGLGMWSFLVILAIFRPGGS